MNFFKSVFADDPDPPSPKSEPESQSPKTNQPQQDNPDSGSSSNPDPATADSGAGAWSFGGLMRTLTTRSESVIETYRRDLKEFGSGLRKELEVAQGSLGNVSVVIDEFGNSVLKGTAQIISHGKDAILAADNESDSSDSNNNSNINNSHNNSGQQKRYSRFDAQVRLIQGDVNTYCEEVDDLDEYNKWKSGFVLDDMTKEIERLLEENGDMENIYKRVVLNTVDHETFWFRYFYRVFKLKQAENFRATLVRRAISREEEELSWDVDDDDDENESNVVAKDNLKENEDVGSKNSDKVVVEEANVSAKSDLSENKGSGDKASEKIIKNESSQPDDEGEKISKINVDEDVKGNVAGPSTDNVVNEKGGMEKSDGMNKENSGSKSDEKVTLMGKAEPGESSKDSDFSVVSSQPSMPEEEDLGWDEIEDLSCIDEKKVDHAGSPDRAELRKRLSVAEDDEDLSWDIADEDEPVKA
ncbi:BSD domain-containing protein 1 [Melia azedarach]|uniref:BSD domain-containing protein 1 n=1 Tax=Melia azedarach TaxID=155640 RepID=A0ACC1YUZ7_MELAZ|nr:BSD domain-containing protein 1 [Melia azedarach]